MKKLLIVLAAITISSGCTRSVPKDTIDTCIALCKNNGGMKSIIIRVPLLSLCQCNSPLEAVLTHSVVKKYKENNK